MPTHILRPDTDVLKQWNVISGTGATAMWQVLNENVLQPAAMSPPSNEYIQISDNGRVAHLGFAAASLGGSETVNEVKCWIFVHQLLSGHTITLELKKGDGTLLDSATYSTVGNNAWTSLTYTGSLTPVELDALEFVATLNEPSAVGSNSRIGALYLEVTTDGPPATPTGLAASEEANESAYLTWDAASDATGYRLRRDGVIVYDGPNLSFVDTGLTNNTSYTYTISAYNGLGESAQSAGVTATPVAVTVGYGGYSSVAALRPHADWRPYADSAPINTPIDPTVDVVHPRSDEMVAAILALDVPAPANIIAGQAGTVSDYYHPVYFSTDDDPLFTLNATNAWGVNPIDGLQIRIPDDAQPAAGGDGHLAVITPDGWEYDLWEVATKPVGGGQLDFSWGGRTRIDGDGLGAAATAAGLGLAGGIIRGVELEAGLIDHALFMTIPSGDVSTIFGYGTQLDSDGVAFVWPADKGGAAGTPGTDLPPMGVRLWLDMTEAEINALSVPAWKKTVMHALATYGAFMGDTGGGTIALHFESGSSYTSFGETDPLVDYALAHPSDVTTAAGPTYVFRMSPDVDWANRLKVVVPGEWARTGRWGAIG